MSARSPSLCRRGASLLVLVPVPVLIALCVLVLVLVVMVMQAFGGGFATGLAARGAVVGLPSLGLIGPSGGADALLTYDAEQARAALAAGIQVLQPA